jgi:hypothetical protein
MLANACLKSPSREGQRTVCARQSGREGHLTNPWADFDGAWTVRTLGPRPSTSDKRCTVLAAPIDGAAKRDYFVKIVIPSESQICS